MKKMFFIWLAVVITIGSAIFSACKKEKPLATIQEDKPNLDYSYDYESVLAFSPASSGRVTNAGARLGRVLFYDKKLSQNNTISCASCHKQEFAFSDNTALSSGFNGEKTGRNSMTIVNAISSKGFFWDDRTKKLEDMVLQPVRHQVEMGLESSTFLIEKLNATSYYPQLFNEAFGSPTITKEAVGKALAQFIYAMFTVNTRADQSQVLFGGWNSNSPILTTDEKRGAFLFQNVGCAECHSGQNLRGWDDSGFENIGLDSVYADKGMGAISGNPAWDGVFKIPSLRNIELTAPYMHDGRFSTLEQVVEHYNSGVKYSPTLSYFLRKIDPVTYQPLPEALRLNLTENDKRCLVAFLKTLTDYSLVSDKKFSNPF